MRVPALARVLTALVVCVSTTTALSQEVVDLGVVDRIKDEAFTRSAVMEHLRNLTDVHGPRLTGSPQFDEAAKWAAERLTSYGLSNVHLERWGPFGRSWSIDEYSAELVAPHYMRLAAMPLAWSASTAGVVTGEPLVTPLDTSFLAGFKKISENFAAYRQQWSGKLRGRIVLLTADKPTPPRERALFTRLTDAELAGMTGAPEPAAVARISRARRSRVAGQTRGCVQAVHVDARSARRPVDRSLRCIGARALPVLRRRGRGRGSDRRRSRARRAARAEAAGSYRARDPLAPPTFVISAEHYDRVARLVAEKQPVKLRLALKTTVSDKDVDGGQHRRRDSWRRAEGRGRDDRRALRLLAFRHRRDRQRRRQRGDDRGRCAFSSAQPEARSHGPHRAVGRRRAGAARIAGLREGALRGSRRRWR